ncbi:thioredoxin family protein [Agarivorans sp. Alg241-V36]|uniref:thioredoxin family protein n=1 Tax=Agarivorans sp. Alg241-V36 TaxID=2305992 RepID=UPI0013D70F5E|nr:thioredoxin family protein [Agarivorans sp. Alg241-V36]
MKTVQVYGTGCKNCVVTAERITQVAEELGLQVEVEKVTGLEDIMKAGVMSTPGLAVNGRIVHSGSVPTIEQVQQLLA